MRGWQQLLANVSGRCAAFFMKAQLYFLGLEKARLERRFGSRADRAGDREADEPESPQNVIQLLAPIPGRRRVARSRLRSRDYVA